MEIAVGQLRMAGTAARLIGLDVAPLSQRRQCHLCHGPGICDAALVEHLSQIRVVARTRMSASTLATIPVLGRRQRMLVVVHKKSE